MHDGLDLRPSKMDDPDTEMDDSSCAWLEGFPVTATLGPAGPVIQQLRSLTTVANVVSKDEIQMLANNLEVLCISLMHQSEAAEPLSFTARCWMSEVRELCYDTKNYLDDAPFISKQDDDHRLTPEEKQENAQFEFQMLEARVMHANKRRERYGFDQQQCIINKPKCPPSIGRRLQSVIFPELIDGGRLDNLGNLIWRKDEGQQLTVVSLVGLEGVGKTTLAKRIYHHVQTCEQFHCRAFAKVSRNPDMRRLLTTIFTQIHIQSPPDFSSPSSQPPARCLDAQDLIANIQLHLRHKRYLIIIDDLWSASVWDIIRRAFPDNGCHSRIIATTQFEDVASACCSYQSKYLSEIKPLKHGQSQELFFSMFGSKSEVGLPKDFGEVSYEIIEKCGGLPLSIVNIASMLPAPSKQNLQEWMDIRDSLPSTLRANPTPEGIKQVLNLIYNNLTPQLKTCLLYLVLYPEGCTVTKDDLAKQWIVEGIIEEGQNKEEVAGGYFDELVSRGMIQVVDNYLGVLSCTLHHMVYDLIVKKSVEENFIIVVDYFQPAIGLPPKVHRLSVQFGGARSARIPAGIMASEVRSLAFFGFCGCADFIEEYKLLQVLVLHVWDDQGDATFELSGISKLLALRYLKIECNAAVKLPVPAQFGDLQHLEVDTPVLVIPSDIGGLGRLSSLKIAVRAISMEDIRILQNLEALSALSLHVWNTPVEMIVFDKGGFLVLKSFEFRCPVPWLKFEAGSMPCLRNLSLCFNAHEAERHGTATISIEHLPGLKEIIAHIWVSDTDVRYTFRTIISNHSSNPIIDEQLIDPIFHGHTTTSKGTIKMEDKKKQADDTRMSTFPWSKRTVNLLGSSSCVPVQGAEKKLKLEIKTEVKAETFTYGHGEMAHGVLKLKIQTKNIDDKLETKFDIPEDMHIEQCTPSSPMKTESIEDKLQTKFDILEDKNIEHWMPSSPMSNRTDMNWQPAGWEDEKKLSDIRMCNSPGSSSHVPDSGSDMTSKVKTETGYIENRAETHFDYVEDMVVEPQMTTSGICQFVKLFQWAKSAISSQYSGLIGSREQELQGELLELEERLQGLRDTLPKMYALLDRAEWSSHEDYVVELLPNLKDALYDAEDLLDEFKWYELKVTVEGNANQCPFSDFFNDVITGSFNEKVQCIQDKLENLSNQLEKMGLHEARKRFDKSVRLETTCLLNETKIFGRDKEMKQVMRLLSKPKKSSDAQSENKDNDESKIPGLHVLTIVGIGGVGKTCLAQHVCNHSYIRSNFDLIIWISVSDDFDAMRLTKQALEYCSGERPTSDDLGTLQDALYEHVRDKKVLIILDGLWGDAFKEDSKYWNIFCAPLKNIGRECLMLVTTRSPMVAHKVCTMNPFTLHGLKEDDAFWNFFKQCIFGSESSNYDPNLEHIGKSILPKLKGSPLAAKSVGPLLRMDLRASHWNDVLGRELWELKQEKTDILPSLQLSYMYLPLRLRRCFAFCAVYPKDYRFEKHVLAEIWVAEGFVDPKGDTPAKDISCQYFDELVNESFFEKSRFYGEAYRIPHLLHDMAKLVSKNDCFIIREKADFGKVPPDVRHLSIFQNDCFMTWQMKNDCFIIREGIDHASLLSLCKHTKLRTLLFDEVFGTKDISAVIDHWCSGLHRLRVMCCGSTNELPDSIGNLKHLRYLEITGACSLNSVPSAFCHLYSLQIVYARDCKLETMRGDFSNLISLRRFKSHGFDYSPGCVLDIDLADWQGLGLGLIKNVSDVKGLRLRNLGKMSKNQAAEVELKNKQRLNSLELSWGWYQREKRDNDDRQVLQALEPPTGLMSLHLQGYGGVSLPSWFGPQNLPSLASLILDRCDELESMFLAEGTSLSQRIDDQNEMPVELPVDSSNKDTTGIFPSMTELTITLCQKLSSLEQLIQPAYIPAINKITIENCESLASAGSFVGFHCLEELVVRKCPSINSQCLVAPSLKRLVLGRFTAEPFRGNSFSFGNLGDNIECCSLANFKLTCDGVTCIQLENWNLPALRELEISVCPSLRSIGQVFTNLSVCGRVFSSLTYLHIVLCEELSAIHNLLSEEYLPVIQKIEFEYCRRLVSLPVEIGSLSSLRELKISGCPSIRWPSGLVFPSSLEWLELSDSGDMCACVPSCLENLTSLVSLTLERCPGITVIPEKVWSKSLQQLRITECPDLVSIGGAGAIAQLRTVTIEECPKMEDIKQPHKRGRFNYYLRDMIVV
ncbi:uncharacterized protein LOC119270807 [Triticum dicoccoides]|uniref:uncharacterized protein LOC119270807 n=1 Tax=Triticum dicoccoides TaxID=85692 RepID=UPI000E7A05D2|nr:uncharacterized protein LOC119270807 [Triticum dicoccoides]